MYGSSIQSRSFDQESGGGLNEVKNNIFSNEAGGLVYYIENTNSFGADNNVFYCPEGSFAYYNDFIEEFIQWKSATNKDLNSFQADPDFISQTDLHAQQKLLTAKGAPQNLVLKDIDGELRDTIQPTPGADRLSVACGGSLAGSYAIGESGDFPAFSDVVLALASCGVNGNVIFYVLPETYEEQIDLSYIRNASDDYTVIFQSQVSDSTSVILRYDADSLQNYVVKLSGIKNVIFRYITIQVADTSGRAVVLEDSVDDIIFDRDRIIGPSSVLDDNFNACVFFGLKEGTDTADIEFSNTQLSVKVFCSSVSAFFCRVL